MVRSYDYTGYIIPAFCVDYTGVGSTRMYIHRSAPRPAQKKNPMLFVGPTPEKVYGFKPVKKRESFKKASNKIITRVGVV